MQNFAPPGFAVEQLPHAGPAAAAGAAAGSRSRRGWRRRRRGLLSAKPGQPAAKPEPGREEGALGRAAALGHALSGAERHLAGRVLPEPAGELRVRGVLRELLELGRVFRRQVDVEVAHPGQRDPVGLELAVGRGDRGLLDLRGVHGQAEDRPALGDDLGGDVGAQHLEQLVAHPPGDPLVVGHVNRRGQVGDQLRRVHDAQRVVPEDPQRHDQPAARVLHVVDPAAEPEPGVLAGAAEVQLGPVRVPAGREVDDRAEARQLIGVDLVPPRPHCLHDLAGIDEHRYFVSVHDRVREAADCDVRPLEDDLALAIVRYRDKFPREQCHGATVQAKNFADMSSRNPS